MARRAQISDEERDGAVIIDGSEVRDANGIMQIGDVDSEAAWDDWIAGLKDSEAVGTVTAHKLPVDADGNPVQGKGTRQIRLGSWPHNLYTMEALCAKLTREFLKPGEIAHVSLMGTQQGSRGAVFRKIVTLQRPATDESAPGGTDLANVIRAMQEAQDRQAQMMERILVPAAPSAPAAPNTMLRDIALAAMPIVGSVLTAIISRPAPKNDLAQMIGALAQLKDLTGIGGSNESEEDSTVSIIKAVAPGAMQLLTTLAANQPQRTPTPVAVRQIPNGTQPSVAAPARKAPRNPAPVPAQSNPAAPSNPQTPPTEAVPHEIEVDPMLAQLAPQLDQLATLAEQGLDPAQVAALVMDQIPDDPAIDEKLWQTVSEKARFDRLLLLSPKLRAHADWAEKLRIALVEQFTDEEEADAVLQTGV